MPRDYVYNDAPDHPDTKDEMELSDLYSDRILEIAGQLPLDGELDHPDASVRKVSRVCGSSVEVDLKLENGRVSDYAHRVSACALGQTASSVVARHIVGATPAELMRLRDEMKAMLKENGAPPSGARWEELKYLEPVREYTPRHASTMLVFDAVVACLNQIQQVQAQQQ